MAQIHPSAVVSSQAQLADDVTIGPFCVVGEHVSIGAGTKIESHSVIEGHTKLGADNRIGPFASLGGVPQDMKYRGEPTRLVIGDRNTIREYTTIHIGTAQDAGVTSVGNDNWIMAYVHIGHDSQVGDHTIFSSNAQIAGHVHVGDWAIVGGMSGVHQFVHIGAHSMLGGASALVQDLPPFVISAGNKATPHGINAEGLKRRGFSPESITALRQAYKTLYKSELSFADAQIAIAEQIKSSPQEAPVLQIFLDFLAKSSRGVIR